MKPTDTALLVVAQVAKADGRLDEAEREYLRKLLDDTGSELTVDALLAVAGNRDLKELAGSVESYADRFAIALQAYLMAFVDWNLDASEKGLYDELVELLGIERGDLEIIAATEVKLRTPDGVPDHPRITELIGASSFA